MKSIETKIMAIIGGVMVVFMIITGVVMVRFTEKTVISDEGYITKLSAERMAAEADSYFKHYISMVQQMARDDSARKLLSETSSRERIKSSEYWKPVHSMLSRTMDSDSQLLSAYFADEDANVAFDGKDWVSEPDFVLSERDYDFKTEEQLQKGYLITDPYVDVETGSQVITISAPVYNEDGTGVLGVAALDVQLTNLTQQIENLELELAHETGAVRLIGASGTILVSPNEDEVLNKIDHIGLSDAMMADYQNPGKNVVQFESGGRKFYGITREVPSAGWKAIITVHDDDFLSVARKAGLTMTALFVAIGIILLIVMNLVARNIARPLKNLTAVTDELAAGNLKVDINISGKDEVGRLADSMRHLTARLAAYIDYINEISSALDEFGEGNLSLNLVQSYDGEFAKIKNSLLKTSDMLKETIGGIMDSSSQVSNGSVEIANSAQTLAQGAVEQASVLEELSATVEKISQNVNHTADNSREAADRVTEVGDYADQSSDQMQQLLSAIQEINNKSSQIGRIIKTIEDIAFQTNILALNAAVEAARAGNAGKGFAVVADEVRNLANKSAEAAKNTTVLIDSSIEAVNNGTRIAEETSRVLNEVITGVKATVERISSISAASNQQAEALAQALQGLEQVNSVVQSNSATAEESSAASEELSAQAKRLKALSDKFRM